MSGWANYDAVLRQMRAAGLVIDETLRLSDGGRSVRCFVEDDRSERRGWYYLHEWHADGAVFLTGSFGVFRGSDPGTQRVELTKTCSSCGAEIGLREKVCHVCGKAEFKRRELSAEQAEALKIAAAEQRKAADAEAKRRHERAARWATLVWRSCSEDTAGHPYLKRKKIASAGGARLFHGIDGLELPDAGKEDYAYLRSFAGSLAVPMCDNSGSVRGLQFILPARDSKTGRDKTNWPASLELKGHYWTVGRSPSDIVLICEGLATAITLHEATGQPVVVAYSATNLLPVAQAIKARTRGRAKMLICADDDWLQRCLQCKQPTPVQEPVCRTCGKPHGQTNAGVSRAEAVCLALPSAKLWKPEFSIERPTDRKGPTDFNDLRCAEGLQVVTAQWEARMKALEWDVQPQSRRQGALSPTPADPAGGGFAASLSPQATAEGGGGSDRPPARAIMDLDDIVERFVPIDDGTGAVVFDCWTKKLARRDQMIAMLPAGVRGDDIKRHAMWISRGAVYLDEVGFDPTERDPSIKLNTWRGWPMRPRAGKCDRLLDLIEYLCSGDSKGDDVALWLLRWMAYPLQNPGAKMNSAVIMHGPQGTGKTTVFKVLSRIYGQYAAVLNQTALEDQFNADWADSKLFVLAEEVVNHADMWKKKGELKELVTGTKIRVNAKMVQAYLQRNQMNFVFLSNENQPLPLDNDDRRHLVVYTLPERSDAYYDVLWEEIESGGVEAFYDFLMKLDLSDFHPMKRPPMTTAKQSLIDLSNGSDQRFLESWLSGDLDLPVCPCVADDLYAEYQRWCRRNGEFRPRPANQFHGTVHNLSGWDKRRRAVYDGLDSTARKLRHIVTPPIAAMQAAGYPPPANDASSIRWYTECVVQFATQAQLAREGRAE